MSIETSRTEAAEDPLWGQLRHAQDILVDLGYTFDVSPNHLTVYRNDTPIFGLCHLMGKSRDEAMLNHWSTAIATALAHARIYRGHALPATPIFE